MAAIVTKIDIQIRRLLSRLQCLSFFSFFSFSFTELLRGRRSGDEMMAGGEGAEGSLSCTPYVVSFGASLVSVYAWQVLAPSLCSWCLCTRLCQHPPAPLPPDLAPRGVLLLRHHDSVMNLKTEFTNKIRAGVDASSLVIILLAYFADLAPRTYSTVGLMMDTDNGGIYAALSDSLSKPGTCFTQNATKPSSFRLAMWVRNASSVSSSC